MKSANGSTGIVSRVAWIVITAFGLLSSQPLSAQTTPPPSGNGITPADPIGSPDYTPSIRDKEAISLTSQDLSVFLPVVSLPQRGGNTLTIGYYHNAFQWRTEIDVSTVDWGDAGGNYWMDNQYTASIVPTNNSQFPLIGPLQINLPTLSSSIEYVGDSGYCNGEVCYGFPTYCVQNWAFTDWDGNMHSFPLVSTSCNAQVNLLECANCSVQDNAYYVMPIGSSADLSYYRFDGSDPQNIVITDKSGNQYHFTNFQDPFPGEGPYYDTSTNSENYYQGVFSSMVDPNGNTITIGSSISGEDWSYLLTDTTGKQVNIAYNGISYKDSNGSPQQVTLVQTAAPVLPPGGSRTDSWTFPDWGCTDTYGNPSSPSFQQPIIDFSAISAPVGYGYTTYQVQFPQADGQNNRTFTYTFDGLSRLVQTHYPAGGYTRYSYIPLPVSPNNTNAPFFCSTDMMQITDKYECSASSGSCPAGSGNPEAHTQYCDTVNYCSSYDPNYNVVVIDPLNDKKYYLPWTYALIAEADKDSSGNLLHTIQNTFTPQTGASTTTIPPLPTSTVDTTYTSTGALSYTTNYQYLYIPYADGNNSVFYGYTDNVTQKTEHDFNGAQIRSTVNAWNTTGIYSINSSNHIVDRISSSTVTDASTGATTATTYTYDGYANVTSKVIAGSDGLAATYTFTRNPSLDPYHRVTLMTDPDGYATTYSYTDANWTNSACAVLNSYAFLTSVTNAKGQTRSFSYNSCTGKLGSSTDANGKTTAYAYDALGRTAAACYPDAIGILWSGTQCVPSTASASVVNTYNDAVPNSVVHSVQAGQSAPSVQTKTTFDGVSRTITSLLTSDPEGTVETDTSYDLLGRVASISNPYRSSGDSTYGTTTFGYDWANRKTVQTQSDGSSKLYWCYDGKQSGQPSGVCTTNASTFAGTWVDSIDEIGNHAQHVSDALGRLRAVMEPSPSTGALALETDYTYNGLGNLTNVNQKGASGDTARTRGFIYDTFSRLTSSTNSETGTVGYSYYLSGGALCAGDVTLPCSKTDARNVTTNYGYDSLSRLISKTYTNAPAGTLSSCYAYDTATIGVGRLAVEWTQTGTQSGSSPVQTSLCPSSAPSSGYLTKRTFLAYDSMGRITSEQQCTPSTSGSAGNCTTSSPTPFALSYNYDLAGNLNQYTNGLGSMSTPQILFTPQYDGAGRLSTLASSWVDSVHPSPLFTADPANGYTPAGGIQNILLGNNITVTKTYDDRLRTTGELATHP